jgi:hypothetical protein
MKFAEVFHHRDAEAQSFFTTATQRLFGLERTQKSSALSTPLR